MTEAFVMLCCIFAAYGLACFGYGYSLGRRINER